MLKVGSQELFKTAGSPIMASGDTQTFAELNDVRMTQRVMEEEARL